ncbi:CLUMA_CG020995, isoform A [Clunio marinus]|uniref:CLUMA_CG020995, isoform A n=1 Tax=Clunio marinus TaxID=568069 RepID=A0A1J1J8I9_9DIPT|nr:CLUMA_CG020995, isoform A [Clunio marinus]
MSNESVPGSPLISPLMSPTLQTSLKSSSSSNEYSTSLEDVEKNLENLDNFLVLTEDILCRERYRDCELYQRERKRKNKCVNAVSATPPLSFKNGKIFCLGNDGTKYNPSNVQLTHDIVKQIINDQNNYLCFENNYPNSESSKQSSFPYQNKIVKKNEENSRVIVFESKNSQTECLEKETKENIEKEQNIDENDTNTDTKDGLKEHGMDLSNSDIFGNLHKNDLMQKSLRRLIGRFNDRAKRMRSNLEMPITPSSSCSNLKESNINKDCHYDDNEDVVVMESNNEQKSIVEHQSNNKNSPELKINYEDSQKNATNLRRTVFCFSDAVLDPQGRFYISWLFIVTLSFLYNAFVIPLRTSFPFQTTENKHIWIITDLCCDVIYLIDLLFIKHRTMYLYEGFWIRDCQLTRKNYMRKLQFKLDVFSLIPLDLLYLHPYFGTGAVYLRIPRLLKIQSFWEFFKLLDRIIASPHMLRVGKTLSYMLYMIHLTACIYYAVSYYKGLGSNRWVFSGKGHPYVRCFAFATKTATSIGKNPKPYEVDEYLFMTCAWLMGVFVFALLIGQIRDIIATATRSQSEYKQLVDETLEYMRRLNLPTEMQRRVKQWFTFTWEQQRSLDETHILDTLPANLKTDIAISVHIQTLSKVQLFAGCDEAFLRELVLKLRSVIFLPGDYVCRKGEVGKEMYIIKTGQIQVLGRTDEVLATLCTGHWFGEISLLDIGGSQGNRRTADVRSKGFSNLFVLSKSDLQEVIVHYEDARAALESRAKVILKENETRDKENEKDISPTSKINKSTHVVISNPTKPTFQPKFLDAVIQALPAYSPALQLLTKGSKRYKNNQVGIIPTEISFQNELNEKKDNNFDSCTNLTDTQKEIFKCVRRKQISVDNNPENENQVESKVECHETL